jgi:hypothetical protein
MPLYKFTSMMVIEFFGVVFLEEVVAFMIFDG